MWTKRGACARSGLSWSSFLGPHSHLSLRFLVSVRSKGQHLSPCRGPASAHLARFLVTEVRHSGLGAISAAWRPGSPAKVAPTAGRPEAKHTARKVAWHTVDKVARGAGSTLTIPSYYRVQRVQQDHGAGVRVRGSRTKQDRAGRGTREWL